MATAMSESTFYIGVKNVLESWTVLQLAVQHGFGGQHSQEKARWLVGAVEEWFRENSNIEPYELEDFLAVILDNEFDTIADDGSLPQVSQLICNYFKLCQEGRENEVLAKIKQSPKSHLSACQQIQNDKDEEMEESKEDVNHENTVARLDGMDLNSQMEGEDNLSNPGKTDAMDVNGDEEDGWTVVKNSKKKS
ncbi:pre-rRNA-processing protein TSR2 homolog [Ptychodera flava]|uniref:pre-rRNA-processing protein TSR2 homolog n=1 Tax=Ptychodera flava TaxID=63121 RepID=UPI003969DE11